MSKAINPVTEVIFRKYKNGNKEIIALFPYVCETRFGTCESYMHIGQHGTADYLGVMQDTKPATPAEYADLKAELENYGPAEANYNLKVINKISWARYRNEHKAQIRR
jgi:hypothetical protein